MKKEEVKKEVKEEVAVKRPDVKAVIEKHLSDTWQTEVKLRILKDLNL